MRKYVFLFLLLYPAMPLAACDLCGCSNSGSFFGILPQGHRGFVGVRYRYGSYHSHLSSLNLSSRETFRTTELWGRFYPLRRVQVMAFVPYQINEQTLLKTGKTIPLRGLGDVSAMAQYNLLNTFMDNDGVRRVDHNWLVGGGIKLPTGRYRYDENSLSEVANANFQLGTGSTDWMLTTIYTARYKKWGTNVDASYRLTATNPDGYRFGNRLNSSVSLFYLSSVGPRSIMPNVGLFVEQAGHDTRLGVANQQTGGYAAHLSLGTEVYIDQFSAGVSYRHPVAQHLSDGELRANDQFSTHVTYLF